MNRNSHLEAKEIINNFSVTYCIAVKEKIGERLQHFERNFQSCWAHPLIGQQDTSCPGNQELYQERYLRCLGHRWIEWSQWKQRTKPTSFLFAQWNSNEQALDFRFEQHKCRKTIIICCFIIWTIQHITFIARYCFMILIRKRIYLLASIKQILNLNLNLPVRVYDHVAMPITYCSLSSGK